MSAPPRFPELQSPSQPAPTAPLAVFCGACGYNLGGAASGRCPECGREFTTAPGDLQRIRLLQPGELQKTLLYKPFRNGLLTSLAFVLWPIGVCLACLAFAGVLVVTLQRTPELARRRVVTRSFERGDGLSGLQSREGVVWAFCWMSATALSAYLVGLCVLPGLVLVMLGV